MVKTDKKKGKGEMKKFTLKTREGCKNYMILFICLILVFSFVASLIQSDFGKIKITNVKFDARGAVQDADLYIPVGTNSNSKLPIMILSHGGGCTKEVMNGFAQELARRGYAVLNVSSYGAGLSEQPMYDEDGSGIDKMAVTSQGLWDAVNYARTLTFVDQTKIMIAGHSQGGYRCGYAALNDCTYYTVDDMLINFMYEQFGIEFTADEIKEDASVLADKYLDDSQKLFFEEKKAEFTEYMDTRLKGVVSIGSNAIGIVDALAPAQVTVAGHEVTRYLQTNIALLCGEWDHNIAKWGTEIYSTEYFQTGDKMYVDTWVQVDGDAAEATIIGELDTTSIVDNEALAAAIADRSTRIAIPVEKITHSSEFLSKRAVTGMVQYVEQLVDYNNGPITGENTAIAADDIVWMGREYCNFLALLAMLGFAVSLLSLLIKGDYYAPVKVETAEEDLVPYGKTYTYIVWVLIIGILSYCAWLSNNSMKMQANPLVILLPSNKFLPLDLTSGFVYVYMSWSAIIFAVMLLGIVIANKKIYGKTGLAVLGIKMKPAAFLKAVLVSVVIFLCCYASMAVISYLFGQDYRLWMCVFTDMQRVHWGQLLRYLIFLIPTYFVASAVVNMVSFKEDKFVASIVVAVVIGSLGVWLNHFVHVIGMYTGSNEEIFFVKLISEGSITGGMLIFVPITIFIAKICHKLTGSIWVGTLVNSLLTGWMWVSAISATNIYMGTTFVERFFGL